jgi:hypothetical protein
MDTKIVGLSSNKTEAVPEPMQLNINGVMYYTVNHPFAKQKGQSTLMPLDVAGGIANLKQEVAKLKNELRQYQAEELKEQSIQLQRLCKGRQYHRYGTDEEENEVDRDTLFSEFCDNFYDRVDLTDDNGNEVHVTDKQLDEIFKKQYGI